MSVGVYGDQEIVANGFCEAKNLAELSLSFIVFGHARFFCFFFYKKVVEIILGVKKFCVKKNILFLFLSCLYMLSTDGLKEKAQIFFFCL